MTQTTKPQAGNCGCAGTDQPAASGACSYADYRRVRFFHGMPLDHQVLLAEQGYHVARRWQLNRLLHGSGIVCGLSLTRTERPFVIQVEPGFGLDPCGRELELVRPMTVDLREWCRCVLRDVDDPCPEETSTDKRDLWIALCHQERPSDPIPSYDLSGCCESPGCEYSRVHEGVCIKILKDAPRCDPCECYPKAEEATPASGAQVGAPAAGVEAGEELYCCGTPPCCPPCGDCIVLGKVTIDCCTGKLDEGDWKKNCMDPCRRYVFTPHLLRDIICRLPVKAGSVNPFAQLLANPYQAICEQERRQAVADANQTVNMFMSPGVDEQFADRDKVLKKLDDRLKALEKSQAADKGQTAKGGTTKRGSQS